MSVASDRLAAWGAADATLSELGIDTEAPVDVYRAIDASGVFLSFQKLGSLLGFALPKHRGVVITTERQASVRRYTAAHELGHCVMHEGLLLDGEREILGSSPVERERQAQMFAAYFLLPPALSYRLAERHGIGDGSTSSGQIYEAARDAGASFEALARHFTALEIIDAGELDQLLARRSRAKTDAAFGMRPPPGHADVWPVLAEDGGAELTVAAGDEIVVSLPENRTTGHRWITAEEEAQRRVRQPAPEPPPFGVSPAQTADLVPREDSEPVAAVQPRSWLRATGDDVFLDRDSDESLVILDDSFRTDAWQPAHKRASARRQVSRRASSVPNPVATPGEHLIVLRANEEGEFSRRFYYTTPFEARGDAVTEWTLSVSAHPGELKLWRRQVLATDVDEAHPEDPGDDEEFGSEL